MRSVRRAPVLLNRMGQLGINPKTQYCSAGEKGRVVASLKLTIARNKASLKSVETHIERYEKSPTTIPLGASEASHNATLDRYIQQATNIIKARGANEALLREVEALPTKVQMWTQRAQEAEARLATCKTQHEAEGAAREAAEARTAATQARLEETAERAAATQAELEETAAQVIPRGKLLAGAAVAFALGRMIR